MFLSPVLNTASEMMTNKHGNARRDQLPTTMRLSSRLLALPRGGTIPLAMKLLLNELAHRRLRDELVQRQLNCGVASHPFIFFHWIVVSVTPSISPVCLNWRPIWWTAG
jgi:hypothetical protein